MDKRFYYTLFTSKTNAFANIGQVQETPLTDGEESVNIESRSNENHDPKNGKFTFSFGHNIRLDPKEYGKITHEISESHKSRKYKNGEPHYIESAFNDVQKFYAFEVKDIGNYRFMYAYVTQSKNGRQCNKKYVAEVKRSIDLWNSV